MVNDDFICVPFNMLQSEEDGKIPYTGLGVEEERKLIRKLIINKPDEDIKKDEDAMAIIRRLGSDTNINAFALNWKYEDQTLNTDLEEANYFMKSVVDRLSIVTANTDPGKIPIILTSTKFSSEDYGLCMEKFVERLGIPKAAQPHQSLFVLRNVVMSPFPTYKEFIDVLMKDFQKVIREEVKVCRERNKRDKKETAQFLVQGSPTGSEVFLVFQTSFHSANRRQQIILKASLDETLHSEFERLRADRKKEIMLESYDILSIEKTVKSIAKGHVPLKAKIYEKTNEYAYKKSTLPAREVSLQPEQDTIYTRECNPQLRRQEPTAELRQSGYSLPSGVHAVLSLRHRPR